MQFDCLLLHPLVQQRLGRGAFERSERPRDILAERLEPALLADDLHVGEADAIGRQDACQRVNEDPLHPQRIGDPAGELAARSAETGERVAGDVMAARDRDLADCIGHIVHGDVEESFGDFLERLGPAERVGNLLQPGPRCVGIERLVA